MDLLMNHDDLVCTAKSMVFSLAEIMFGASSSSPKKHPKTQVEQNLHPGLKTLIHQKEEKSKQLRDHAGQPAEIIHSYMVWNKLQPSPSPLSSSLSSSSSSSSSCCSKVLNSSSTCWSSMGDLIGSESGVYMSSNDEEIVKPIERTTSDISSYTAGGRFNAVVKKEYPPPIPSLAVRTPRNLPYCRMPWVLTRQYTEDGRLILRQTRVQSREYFHAHRENGRLILNLIPMDEQQEDEEEDELELEDLEEEKMVSEEEEIESEYIDDEDEDGIEIRKTQVVGKFPKLSSTYASGMFMDSKQCFCNELGPHTYLDHSSSSSSVPLRPMAAAM